MNFENIFSKYGFKYKINNRTLFTNALKKSTYQKQEYIGDTVFKTIITEYIINAFPDKNVHFLSDLRSKIECGNSMTRYARMLSLDVMSGNKGANDNMLEDMFEAFIGALFYDSNYDTVKSFVTKFIQKEVDFATLISSQINYREVLTKHCIKFGIPEPKFRVVVSKVDYFNVYMYDPITEIVIETAIGTTKQKAISNAIQSWLKNNAPIIGGPAYASM